MNLILYGNHQHCWHPQVLKFQILTIYGIHRHVFILITSNSGFGGMHLRKGFEFFSRRGPHAGKKRGQKGIVLYLTIRLRVRDFYEVIVTVIRAMPGSTSDFAF